MENLWLIGAGQMALDYAKVLHEQEISYKIIGRSKKSALQFKKNFNKQVEFGGIENYVAKASGAKFAIVAVGVGDLFEVAKIIIDAGVQRILIEKPAGASFKQISELTIIAKRRNIKIFVAYNRRFYESVVKARELIKEDGGVKSFLFDFTELGNQVETLDVSPSIKRFWLLANSSHVIDLAFHLCGEPEMIRSIVRGGITWHPSGTIFSGSGITKLGAVFSYHANWESAGRWGLEIITPKRRIILKPLEQLQQMMKDSFDISFVDIDESMNTNYKPGLYRQVKAFISSYGIEHLCSIEEHQKNIATYSKISGYSK